MTSYAGPPALPHYSTSLPASAVPLSSTVSPFALTNVNSLWNMWNISGITSHPTATAQPKETGHNPPMALPYTVSSAYAASTTNSAPGLKSMPQLSISLSVTTIASILLLQHWTEANIQLFTSIKASLISSPCLARYDSNLPCFLKTD
jgi:hypothetical protein